MSRNRVRRKPMSDINVVPYIDVMLVLLIIFMVTAPLITEGVKVDLPQADSQPLQNEPEMPLVITVDREGNLYLDVGGSGEAPVDAKTLVLRVAAVLRNKEKTPVMVRGDDRVDYGHVVHAMVLAQQAGAKSVGLVTETPERE